MVVVDLGRDARKSAGTLGASKRLDTLFFFARCAGHSGPRSLCGLFMAVLILASLTNHLASNFNVSWLQGPCEPHKWYMEEREINSSIGNQNVSQWF